MDDDYKNYEVFKAYKREGVDYVKLTKTHVSGYALAKGQQMLKDMRSAGQLSKQETKTQQSKYRTRKKIHDILTLNLNQTSNFVTLTYKKNQMDYKESTKDFNKMLTYFNQKNDEKLKYIVVKEHQKRGAIHYHMITFNHDKIKWRNYWKHGRVHIESITDIEFPEKIANYMVKYLTKNKEGYKSVEVGFRAFGYSRNLKREEVIELSEDEYNNLNKTIYQMENLDNRGVYRNVRSIVSKKDFKNNVLPF